ncbi:MAG: 3-phosphoshikimate 1-carboxyvinyltransferase [Saprospiraceae bacterium]
MLLKLSKADKNLFGTIKLNGSKSINNRALILRALCQKDCNLENLSNAEDSQQLLKLLNSTDDLLDAQAGGTTFRFLTAYLSMQPGSKILTGSTRMKQRPIGPLVEALQTIGASIEHLEKEGYPPIKIGEPKIGSTNELSIPADISSQFISALLMIAPTLPRGLVLRLEGTIVSPSYIKMTLKLMEHFGIRSSWERKVIRILPQKYIATDLYVEADWSAASYYYGLAAFAENVDLTLEGLLSKSVQGDSVLSEIMEQFGIETTFGKHSIRLTKEKDFKLPTKFEYDFIDCPDIAQTLAVVCAGLGVPAKLTGLQTLRIKETDRIAALKKELAKVQVDFPTEEEDHFSLSGKALLESSIFDTYEDHRMAMSLAMLGMFGPLSVREPQVVGKSYPAFWKDLELVGFKVSKI